MELSFEQKSLRDLCEDPPKAERELGEATATALHARLSDLRAIERISQIPVGNPQAYGDPSGARMSIDLGNDYKLVFCANHNKLPIAASGVVDWSRVTRVRILGVEKHALH